MNCIYKTLKIDGPDGKPITLFESGSIVLYLAEKYQNIHPHQSLLPKDPRLRIECMNWIFWQMGGQGPFTGQFGHFFVYAPVDKLETRDYGVSRYGMEVQRLCSVLDNHLASHSYLVGEEYTIADIMCFPWFHQVMIGYKYVILCTAIYISMYIWACMYLHLCIM